MINYTSSRQLSIEEFKTPFQIKLDKNNRWVVLASVVPWDDMASLYHRNLCPDNGASTVDTRVIIGAMIIKHKLNLDDREVIDQISENPYMQYFLGLCEFTSRPVFDPSLFVTIRKRMDAVNYSDLMSLILADQSTKSKDDKQQDSQNNKDRDGGGDPVPGQDQQPSSPTHKGTLKVDGTVAPQQISYPTDVDLLNEVREQSQRIIDVLWEAALMDKKPRTYRRIARRSYLLFIKKKKKKVSVVRAQVRKQLGYASRNLKNIDAIIAALPVGKLKRVLSARDMKILQAANTLCDQQRQMLSERTHSCPDRIVSIYQPHVRPIVRGKKAAPVEFGAKAMLCEADGFFYLTHLEWDNFGEAGCLMEAVEEYRKHFGYYPATVLVDGIFGTRENRSQLEGLGIEYGGKKLGRPSKESRTAAQKRKWKKKLAQRNRVEGKIGNAKVVNGLDKIKARLAATSTAWIKFITVVMCLDQLARLQLLSPLNGFLLAALLLLAMMPMMWVRFTFMNKTIYPYRSQNPVPRKS